VINPQSLSIPERLASLSAEDDAILMAFPYRVGLFISYADVSGGWSAQDAEMNTLANILREFAEDFCKGECAQMVLMETLQRRAQWPEWSNAITSVPEDDAHRVIYILDRVVPPKEVSAFKDVMVEIALAVAMAFREVESDPKTPATRKVKKASWLAKLQMLWNGEDDISDPLEHINISDIERAALFRLCRAMDYDLSQKQI